MSDPRYKDVPLSTQVTAVEQRQLVRVMEEAAELSIAAAKILRFGPVNYHPERATKETNTEAFRRERDDLIEALRDLGESPIPFYVVSYERRELLKAEARQEVSWRSSEDAETVVDVVLARLAALGAIVA